MNAYADQAQKKGSQATTDGSLQSQSSGESSRPEAVAQRKAQDMADNSPRLKQLRRLQEIVNDSPRTKDLAQLQARADNRAATQESQPVQFLPTHVSTLLTNAATQDPSMMNAPFIVAAVSDWLTQNSVPHRLGGSLAARLHGAGRTPADLDIEVPDGAALLAAYSAVSNMNGSLTVNGITANCQATPGLFATDTFAGVKLIFTDSSGTAHACDVDIVNENNPTFNQSLQSPISRGVAAAGGDLVSAPELVMNYLDRIIQKHGTALTKQDHIQILQILRSQNFNPTDGADVQNLRQNIAAIAQPHALANYLHILTQVINWGLTNPGW